MKQVSVKDILIKKIISQAEEHHLNSFIVDGAKWLKIFSTEELKHINDEIRSYKYTVYDIYYFEKDYDENNRKRIGTILEFAKYCAEYKKTDLQNLKKEYRKSEGCINVYDEYDCRTSILSPETCYVMEEYPNMVELFENVYYSKEYCAPSDVNSSFISSYDCDEDGLRTNKWVPTFIKKQEEKFARLKAEKEAKKAAANKQPVATTPVQTIADVVKANTGRE